MTEPDAVIPPDDAGGDTFARFKYQAHVTFPYCLELTRGDGITNVFAEHIEDIAVQSGTSWRFLQVKTRNANLGPWTFAEAISSGAVGSLWRAYQAVGPSIEATYELQLEGAVRKGDLLEDLASGASANDAVRTRLAEEIGVEVSDVDLFSTRLRVRGLPLRNAIPAANLRLLGKAAQHLSAGEIEQTYETALVAIEGAMTADRLDDHWPAALFIAPDERFRLRLESKRIGREHAQQIFAPILRAAVTPSIPFILPQLDVPTFTGRSDELGRLEAILLKQEGEKIGSIAGVAGAGGIGKSALACHFAEVHRSAFPDGVIGLRVDGKEPISIAREFARCAFAEVDPDDDRDASTIIQEVFRGRRALLIFDNADNVSIRSLLPGGTICAVIVTTRDRGLPVALGIPESSRLDLSPLPPGEAIALLERLVGTRVLLDGDAGARICQLVGNLPLAIQIVGATLQLQAWRSLPDYENDLREEKERLSLLRVRGDSELDVRASFSLSLRLLDSAEVDFFASLSVCAQDGFSIVGAAAANECDERAAQDRLAQLFRLSLINRSSAGMNRFVLHPLLRLFAREQAEGRGIAALAETRHREFYTALVKKRGVTDSEAVALVGEEVDDIVVAAESMQRAGVLDYGFVITLEPFFQRHGHWEKAASIFAAFLHSAEQAGDWTAVVQLRLQQAKFLALRGKLAEAEHLLEGLDALIAHTDPESARMRSTAMWLNSVGGVLQRQGKFEPASKIFERSLDLFMELGDVRGQSLVLNSLGGVLQRQGKFEKAAEAFRGSARIGEALRDQPHLAMALNSLGGVLQRQGKFEEAADHFRRSAAIEQMLGNRRGEAMISNTLGSVLQRKGAFGEAIKMFLRSAEINRQLGDRHGEAMALNSLGGVLQRQGHFDRAIEVLHRSERLLVEIGDQRGEAMVLNSLGSVLQRQGDSDGAIEALRRSERLLIEIGDQRGEAMVLNSLGGVLQRQGDFHGAVDALRRSASIEARLGNERGEAMVLNSLGRVLQQQGDLAAAVDVLRRSASIEARLGNERGEAMVLTTLGGVLQRQGNHNAAVDVLRRSALIAARLGDKRGEAIIHTTLGRALLKTNREMALPELSAGFEIDVSLRNRRGVGIVAPVLIDTLRRTGRLTEASAICERALEIATGDERLLRLKADIDRRRGA